MPWLRPQFQFSSPNHNMVAPERPHAVPIHWPLLCSGSSYHGVKKCISLPIFPASSRISSLLNPFHHTLCLRDRAFSWVHFIRWIIVFQRGWILIINDSGMSMCLAFSLKIFVTRRKAKWHSERDVILCYSWGFSAPPFSCSWKKGIEGGKLITWESTPRTFLSWSFFEFQSQTYFSIPKCSWNVWHNTQNWICELFATWWK